MVPLVSKGKVLATFSLLSSRPQAYAERERKILERAAPFMASAIENSLLFQELDQLALALESIGDAVVFRDTQGKIQFINRAAQETYGYGREQVTGEPVSMFSPPTAESQGQCKEFLVQAMEGTWRGEVKQVRKGGHEFDANLTGTPVRDRSGEVIGIISVAQDVSQTKLAQKLYTTLTVKGKELEMLQKVDHLRKDLIATVSHELRNPLASIKGYISTLLQPDVTWDPSFSRSSLRSLIGRRSALTAW